MSLGDGVCLQHGTLILKVKIIQPHRVELCVVFAEPWTKKTMFRWICTVQLVKVHATPSKWWTQQGWPINLLLSLCHKAGKI